MTRPDLLTIADIAADLGLPEGTVRQYHKRAQRNRREGAVRPGDLPPSDVPSSRTPVWRAATYEAWKASRPGRGAGGGRRREA